jgi:hypothetical protein
MTFRGRENFIMKNIIFPSHSRLVSCLIRLAKNISFLTIILWAAMTSGAAIGQVAGKDDKNSSSRIKAGFESDLASRYIWRGLAFSSGAVTQNSIWFTKWGLTASLWSNYDIGSADVNPRLNEFDLGLAYESSFHNFDFQSSMQSYFYPSQPEAPSTGEFSLNLSYGFPLLQPFTTQTFDIKAYRGAYFGELGLQASQDFDEKLSADLTVEMGWGSAKFNQAYIGEVGSAIDLASCQANMTWSLVKSLYLRPHFCVTTLINQDIRAQVEKATLYQYGAAFGGEF